MIVVLLKNNTVLNIGGKVDAWDLSADPPYELRLFQKPKGEYDDPVYVASFQVDSIAGCWGDNVQVQISELQSANAVNRTPVKKAQQSAKPKGANQ